MGEALLLKIVNLVRFVAMYNLVSTCTIHVGAPNAAKYNCLEQKQLRKPGQNRLNVNLLSIAAVKVQLVDAPNVAQIEYRWEHGHTVECEKWSFHRISYFLCPIISLQNRIPW